MTRNRFLDGTLGVGDLSEVSDLRKTQVATGTGRAFRVIVLPSKKTVSWSFLLGKANVSLFGKRES